VAGASLAWVPLAHGQVAPPDPAPPVAATGGPVTPAVAPVPVTPPDVAEIQAALDQKQYAAAIRMASKLLAMRGDAAGAFSRFQVMMLKGDGQAGAHAVAAARATYQDALRVTNDPHEKALATWTVELFKQARGTSYVPHITGPGANATPIDLVNGDSRKLAFAALLDDQLSLLAPKLKQASGSPSLPQILPVVKQVQALTELDVIATGTDTRTSAAAGTLLDHARNLMSNALKGMWTRVDDIHNAATQTVTGTGTPAFFNGQPIQQTVSQQNGLTGSETAELKQIIDTCGKIHEAAAVFAPLAQGGDDKAWGAILNDANRVAGRASDVLNANYSTPTVSTQYPDQTNGGGYISGNNYYPPGGNGVYGGTYPGNLPTTQTPGKPGTVVTTPPPVTTGNGNTSTTGGNGSTPIPKPTPVGGGAGGKGGRPGPNQN
jgi:hypothetical protein